MLDTLWQYLEIARPWISPVALTGILGLVLSHRLGLRKVQVEAQRVEIAAQEVADKDEADIRDHYAGEVRQLRKRLDAQSNRYRRERLVTEGRFRRILAESERKHEECMNDRTKLRDDSRTMKDIMAGLIRIITQASADRVILLDSSSSNFVRDAAHRINLLFGPEEKGDADVVG